ncbi:MAG: BatD family protein [Tannerellaceae bacterium]|jgi:hypothetical protein|nr:BatD family protein [Tannerellaceae bacterium]
MMKHVFLFIFFHIATVAMAAQKIVIKTEAPDTVTAGKQFIMTFTLNAKTEINSFRTIHADRNRYELLAPFQSVSIRTNTLNGQTDCDTSTVFTTILKAKVEGFFELPQLTVKVNGADYTSNARSIRVLPGDTASSAQDNIGNVFMLMDVSKNSVYEQEEFLATFTVYSESPALKSIKSIDFPKFEGFTTREIELPQEIDDKMKDYNGAYYYSIELRQIALTPTRTGMITIGGGKFEILMKIKLQKETKSFFELLTDDYREEYKIVTTEPTVIEVKPLPAGKAEACTGKAVNRIAGAQACLLNTKTL